MAILRYEYDIIGQQRVAQSLASMERLFASHSTKISRLTGSSPRASSATAAREASSSQRQVASGFRERQRLIDRISSSQAALARQRTKEEREVGRIAQAAARDRQRDTERQVRAQSTLSRQREKEARASDRQNRRAAEQFRSGTLGRSAGRVVNGLTSVGTAGAAMLGIGGAAIAATSVQQALKLDEMSRRLSIQGRAPGEAGVSPTDLSRQFTRTGIATGIAPEQIAAGASSYVAETGDLGGAMANLSTFATTAQATGASIEEIATAAAHMRKLGITSVEDMQQALATLTMQGKKGSFEIKNMAAEFPEVTAQAANFGVRGLSGLTQLGGILQVAKTATGSGAEASTATQTMFRQLAAKSTDIQTGDAFEGRKVNVFEGGNTKGKLRDIRDIIGDVLVASRGDLPQLQQVFDVRGIKAVNPLISKFREVRTSRLAAGDSEKTADEAGRAAALGVLDSASNVAGNFSDIQRDAADAMKSTSVQLEILNSKLKEAFASQLLPAINALVPRMLEMVPTISGLLKTFADLASWLAENPLKGIGMAFAASLAFELAKARLGALTGSIITAILTRGASVRGSGLGGALGGAGVGGVGTAPIVAGTRAAGGGFLSKPGMGAMGAAAGTGLLLGAAVAAGIYGEGVASFNTGESAMDAEGRQLNAVRGMTGIGDIGAAQQAAEAERKRLRELTQTGVTTDAYEGIYHLLGGGPTDREVQKNTAESSLKEIEARLAALQVLKDVSDKLSASGVKQSEAADKLNEAAIKLGLVKPNRSDKPDSPVKT